MNQLWTNSAGNAYQNQLPVRRASREGVSGVLDAPDPVSQDSIHSYPSSLQSFQNQYPTDHHLEKPGERAGPHGVTRSNPALDPGGEAAQGSLENVFWNYVDETGNIQGPFSSLVMSQWFLENWLPWTLYVCKLPLTEYMTLAELQYTTGAQNPFSLVISPQRWEHLLKSGNTHHADGTVKTAEPAVPSLPKAPSLARVVTPARSGSPWAASPQTSTWRFDDLATSLPKDQTPALQHSHPQEYASGHHEPENQSFEEPSPLPVEHSKPKATKQANAKVAKQATPEVRIKSPNPQPAKKQPKKPTAPQKPEETPEPETVSKEQVAAKLTPAQDQQTSMAWNVPKAPAHQNLSETMAQMRQLEVEKRQRKEAATRARVGTPSVSATPPLPPVANWASSVRPPSHPQSLAEAQRELKAKTKTVQSSSYVDALPRPPVAHGNDAGLQKTVRTQAPMPAHQPTLLAKPKKPQNTLGPVAQSTKNASPAEELLRWCEQSFQQGLARNVNQQEFLELIFSLPNTNDAKEFVAESIYSYSATLDGRRFAQDFFQRRKQAESHLKQGETWAALLAKRTPAKETDPSFTVVSTKKKFRPLARPSE